VQKVCVFNLNYSFFCPLDSAAGGGRTTLPAPSYAPDGVSVQFCIIIIISSSSSISINVSVIYFVCMNSPAQTVYENTFHCETFPSLYDVDLPGALHHRFGHRFV
jgi:hypothetical protein